MSYYRIDKLEWNNGRGLEDLSTFGIAQLKLFAKIIDDMIEGTIDEDTRGMLVTMNRIIMERLDLIDECLLRFQDWILSEKKDCKEE